MKYMKRVQVPKLKKRNGNFLKEKKKIWKGFIGKFLDVTNVP